MSSIATSVVAHPSRLLRCLMLAMSALLISVAVLLWQMPATEAGLVLHQLLAMVCAAAALRLFYSVLTLTTSFVIDIYGTGVIRLHHTGRVAAGTGHFVSNDQQGGEVVQLLKDSTLWSSMMLLRLRLANGQLVVIPVLSDAMSADAFRHLSIACRWIIRQDTSHDVK
ncbi:MAG: protein YgfX [Oxalobacteraceae bacterium]